MSPQEWLELLALIAENVRPPDTAAGVLDAALDPVPSCPLKPAPQQNAEPPLVSPQPSKERFEFQIVGR